jgi:hypothetical protein
MFLIGCPELSITTLKITKTISQCIPIHKARLWKQNKNGYTRTLQKKIIIKVSFNALKRRE